MWFWEAFGGLAGVLHLVHQQLIEIYLVRKGAKARKLNLINYCLFTCKM